MTILDCCFADVTHTKANFFTGTYTVRYIAITDVPYTPNSLINTLVLGGCIDQIGSSFAGFPADVIAARSAISLPDPLSFLKTVEVDKQTNLEGGDRLRYVITLNYEPAEPKDSPTPPPGEDSPNPLDWCPLYRERSVKREVEAETAQFGGLYSYFQLLGPCLLDNCGCEDFTPTFGEGDVVVRSIAPDVGSGPEFTINFGECTTPVNTAGDKIVGLTKFISDTEVSMTKWFPLNDNTQFDETAARCMRDSINENQLSIQEDCWRAAPIITIEKETGFLEMDWEIKTTTEIPGFPIFRYWEVNYLILVRQCGWFQDFINEGLNRIYKAGVDDGHGGVAVNPQPGRVHTVQILQADNKGETVTRPVPLDDNGQPIISRDPGDIRYSRWRPQGVVDWVGIGL